LTVTAMSERAGLVFDIKHFAVHDGPGLRTTVFLKGCPLMCEWCHSPESQSPHPEIMVDGDRCIGCGECVANCPRGAISGPGHIDRTACDGCGRCAEGCYAEALELVGRRMTVSEVLAEVERDRLLIEVSGGGVTLSGGEPLAQPDFAEGLLKSLKERGYHTALDTCGQCNWDTLSGALENVDLVLYDVKHMDPEAHLRYTGASNELIMSNLERTLGLGKRVWIRVPLIPGVNDDDQHLRRLGKYLGTLGAESVQVLPYHVLGVPKYEGLGRRYALGGLTPHEGSRLREVRDLLRGYCDNVIVKGVD
jgi:pyruvate formate lyase activating enzyme